MKTFKVGTFTHPGKTKLRISAYTLWYSPEWSGCMEFVVEAASGAEAKRKAIALRLAHEDKIARCPHGELWDYCPDCCH